MKDQVMEQAFLEANEELKELFNVQDRRTLNAKHKLQVAEQEFLASVKEHAKKWFRNKIRSIDG